MNTRRWYVFAAICVFQALAAGMAAGCVSAPVINKPQYSQRHYKFTILYAPELLNKSPKLDLALSLVIMNYPAGHTGFFNEVLYQSDSPDSYKDKIIQEQREMYRLKFFAQEEEKNQNSKEWYYREAFNVASSNEKGVVIERVINKYDDSARSLKLKRFYVLDMESFMQIKIDDLFQNYQGDETRAVIYEELRNFSGLEDGRPLSEGIYLTDEPELSFNFFLTEEGLGLHWDPYEIAPYSEGGIDVVIPWRKIRPLMLHSGMEMLTKFKIYLFV